MPRDLRHLLTTLGALLDELRGLDHARRTVSRDALLPATEAARLIGGRGTRDHRGRGRVGDTMRREHITVEWLCDRCGGDMRSRSYSYELSRLRIDWRAYDERGNGAGRTEKIELCDPCTRALRTFVAGRNACEVTDDS